MNVGYVVVRNQSGQGQVDVGLHLGSRRFPAHLAHCFIEQLGVEVVADRRDRARLIRSEQIACASNLQIVGGDRKSRSQLAKRLQHLQPPLCIPGNRPARGDQQIRVGALAGSANASAELVELRQPEGVGAVDDHRVRGRDVDSALDDRGAEQQLVPLLHEVVHHLFELSHPHLPMRNANGDLRNELFELSLHRADRLDPVVDEEDLASSLDFPLDRLANLRHVELDHEGADRPAILRGSGHDAHVSHSRHGHVQRARNGSGGEREHIHLCPQALDLFLVLDSEPLLFIHHQESEVLEADVAP